MKMIRLRRKCLHIVFSLVFFGIHCLSGFSLNTDSYKNEEGELSTSNSFLFDSHFPEVNNIFPMIFNNYDVLADTIIVDQSKNKESLQDAQYNYSNKDDEMIIKEIEKKLFERMKVDISKISDKKNEELASKSNFNSNNGYTPSAQNSLPSQAEYNALMDFYQATDGANWTQNSGWNTANPNVIQDVSAFYGVSTNASGNVVGIFLPNNEVIGELPESIGNLIYLEQLYLFSNNLYQHIPQSIGNLISLKGLYLNSSRINYSTIPESIGDLINLEYLNLHANNLQGTVPVSIGNLTKLKELNLFSTHLGGDIPASLGNLVDLQFLGMMGANFTGPIPTSFSNLTKLYEFRVHNNQFTGPIPGFFCSFPNLNTLTLYNNNFTGSLPACLYTAGVGSLLIANNNFLFGSVIEMALNISNPSDYLPQRQSQDTVYVNVIDGDFLTLSTDLGTTTQGVSEYRWVKNGVPLFPNFQQNAFDYTDNSFPCAYYPEGSSGPNSCNGVYYVEIKNSLLPVGTVLKGPTIVVKTIPEILNMTICLLE